MRRHFARAQPLSNQREHHVQNKTAKQDTAALPETLVAELTAYRTSALRNSLAEHADTALRVLLHNLAEQVFYGRPFGNWLNSLSSATYIFDSRLGCLRRSCTRGQGGGLRLSSRRVFPRVPYAQARAIAWSVHSPSQTTVAYRERWFAELALGD